MAAPPGGGPRPTPSPRSAPRTPRAAGVPPPEPTGRGTGSRSARAASSSHLSLRTLLGLPRHFLTGAELSASELGALIDRAIELKAAPDSSAVLAGRTVAL